MAIYYVKSSAAGTNNGSSWINAFTTLKVAIEAPRLAGDVFYVSSSHAETSAAPITITSPGTPLSPQRVYSVNDSATPPTALLAGASITTTGANALTVIGSVIFDGLVFSAGTGAVNADLVFGNAGTSQAMVFRNCSLRIPGTTASSFIYLSPNAVSSRDYYHELTNCSIKVGNGAANPTVYCVAGRVVIRNLSFIGPTFPSVLFGQGSSFCAQIEVSASDLSPVTTNLAGNSGNSYSKLSFRNCKLAAGIAPVTSTPNSQGGIEVYIDNCDSANTNYRMEQYKYPGTIVQETTRVKASGASDDTTPVSWKMVSYSGKPTYHIPLASPPITFWNDVTGSSKTISVDILHDSLTKLKDDEVWLEVEYLGDASFPTASVLSDRSTDVFATALDQAVSGATWTTTGMTNPNKQKVDVTFTPQKKGLIRATVCLAKSPYTIYVDPVILGSGREYFMPGSGQINEPANTGATSYVYVPIE